MLKFLHNTKNKYLNINKLKLNKKLKKRFFSPESLDQKRGCALIHRKVRYPELSLFGGRRQEFLYEAPISCEFTGEFFV